jgi:putative FmdB family regulatory protein
MPTYEYECLSNGHRFEVKQSFTDPAIEVCEVCGEPVRKVFSAAGIVFKGSGYYVTDSRKDAKKTGASGVPGKESKPAKVDGAPAKADSGSSSSSSSGSSSSGSSSSGSSSSDA